MGLGNRQGKDPDFRFRRLAGKRRGRIVAALAAAFQ
jgi:hypothetical protein